jgi:hypothetical protein
MPLHYNMGYQSNVFEIPIHVVPNTTAIPQLGTTIPQVTVTIPQPTVTISTHVLNEPIYNVEPTESVGAYGRLDDFPEQFDEMQREIRALRGNDLFGKNAHDLCLVPNVRIPTKFKVPEFEKYRGNSCPQCHLVMYAKKMSTQTDNHQLLIHYF